jgi:glutamate/tyrosine decarboxylase-like PLP-dependent enzyme
MTFHHAKLFSMAAQHAAEFRAATGDMPQRPLCGYAEMAEVFDEPLPRKPGEPEAIIAELTAKAARGLQMITGPRFFAWVMGSSHPVSAAADMLASGLGQNTGNHHAAPAASAAETVAAKWLLELLDLPAESSVGFVTGATMANFVCLAAARGDVLRRAGWDAEAQGLFGAPTITVLIGDDAHTSNFSALQFLGLGHDRVVRIPTTAQGVMLRDACLDRLMHIEGPKILLLQAGQLNTGAFDQFEAIIPKAHEAGAWVHVDGAFGLWARACPSRKALTAGVELADSWATDGHKWLQAAYDNGFAIVRHEAAHRRAMAINASYLKAAGDNERNPADYVPELSRRARGFPVWAAIKALGSRGIADMVERHCALAQLFAELLEREPGISVLNNVVLNQAIISFGSDDLTMRTITEIQRDGTCFLGGGRWRGEQIMRLSVIGFDTSEKDIRISADAVIRAFKRVKANS